MDLHFFQRYHKKEDVVTANAMLLISRLYHYSSSKFYMFMQSAIMPDEVDMKLSFKLQEKSKNSVLDASITQDSFKIAIETKLYGQFAEQQLINHLEAFTKDIKHKVLLTLDPMPIDSELSDKLISELKKYNKAKDTTPILHKHLTFEQLIEGVESVLDSTLDYEFMTILNDYKEFCLSSDLLPNEWKWLRAIVAGTTIDFNIANNVYYDQAGRGYSEHAFIGLYNRKSIRAIGKVICVATGEVTKKGLVTSCEEGNFLPEYRDKIALAISDAENYGYDLSHKHRYFFVDEFHETDFIKSTPYPIQRSKFFDLSILYDDMDKDTTSKEIADFLVGKTWE